MCHSINLSQLVQLYSFELFVECTVFTVSAFVSLLHAIAISILHGDYTACLHQTLVRPIHCIGFTILFTTPFTHFSGEM